MKYMIDGIRLLPSAWTQAYIIGYWLKTKLKFDQNLGTMHLCAAAVTTNEGDIETAESTHMDMRDHTHGRAIKRVVFDAAE